MNYEDQIQQLKQNVALMLQERSANQRAAGSALPSAIWIEALSMFNYVINLSAEEFRKIRYHTGLITGNSIFAHWHQYPPIDPERFAEWIDYKFYTEGVPQDCWLGEPPTPQIPRPIGLNYRGKIINADIGRYQHCATCLYTMGVVDYLAGRGSRNLVLEIGGGYGGLAHQLGSMLGGHSTYIIVDLPEMLLFSGGCLIVNNPGKRIYVYNPATFTPEFLKGKIFEYDFVLLPNYVLQQLRQVEAIHLMMNMQSFQEMSREQIEEYLDFGRDKLQGFIYSNNVDRHPFNDHLLPATVTSLLDSRFDVFPPTHFYESHARAGGSAWAYKAYIGIPKGSHISLGDHASMRVSDGISRYQLTRNAGKLKIKISRDWISYLISIARKILGR